MSRHPTAAKSTTDEEAGAEARLGAAIADRSDDISRTVIECWQARSPEAAGAADLRVLNDIIRFTEIATSSLTSYLERGALPNERDSREVAATGKAPLRDTIALAELTKLYLYWRDVMLSTLDGEARRVGVAPGDVDRIASLVRSASDGSIVRMTKQFDVERERLQRELAIEQQRLAYQAFHDPLTGLPNRRLFFDRLHHALALAPRLDTGQALLFVDVDDFKRVNDHHGHQVGDEVLIHVAERLVESVRASDTVARFAGDEFTILLENLAADGSNEAEEIADRAVRAVAEPVRIDGTNLAITVSAGLAYAIADDNADAIIQRADRAMYSAKRRSRGTVAQASA